MDFKKILDEAHAAAALAVEDFIEDKSAFDCGFAWVKIGGREPLAFWCRKEIKRLVREYDLKDERAKRSYEQNLGPVYGRAGHPTGWQWWCPGAFKGQSVRGHEKGAHAFRNVLARYGIVADSGSRLD